MNPPAVDSMIDGAVDRVVALHNRVARSKLGDVYERVRTAAPHLDERLAHTPFGSVKLPDFVLPPIAAFSPTTSQREALKAACAIDLSFPIGFIPIVGDIIEDIVGDMYSEKLYDSLTAGERARYLRYDKGGPSTIAAVRAISGV